MILTDKPVQDGSVKAHDLTWRLRFAWFPVRVSATQRVWLELYWAARETQADGRYVEEYRLLATTLPHPISRKEDAFHIGWCPEHAAAATYRPRTVVPGDGSRPPPPVR